MLEPLDEKLSASFTVGGERRLREGVDEPLDVPQVGGSQHEVAQHACRLAEVRA